MLPKSVEIKLVIFPTRLDPVLDSSSGFVLGVGVAGGGGGDAALPLSFLISDGLRLSDPLTVVAASSLASLDRPPSSSGNSVTEAEGV